MEATRGFRCGHHVCDPRILALRVGNVDWAIDLLLNGAQGTTTPVRNIRSVAQVLQAGGTVCLCAEGGLMKGTRYRSVGWLAALTGAEGGPSLT